MDATGCAAFGASTDSGFSDPRPGVDFAVKTCAQATIEVSAQECQMQSVDVRPIAPLVPASRVRVPDCPRAIANPAEVSLRQVFGTLVRATSYPFDTHHLKGRSLFRGSWLR